VVVIERLRSKNNSIERIYQEMREKQYNQKPILIPSGDHPRAEELQRISDILDANPIISKMVWQDLTRGV
jgi:hypothetical protein